MSKDTFVPNENVPSPVRQDRSWPLLGFNDRGQVREGYLADLLIVRGDPSKDIEAAADRARHAYVFKNGFDALATLGPPKSGAVFPRFSPETAAV